MCILALLAFSCLAQSTERILAPKLHIIVVLNENYISSHFNIAFKHLYIGLTDYKSAHS